MGMEGLRTKRWNDPEEFFGILIAKGDSLTFASGKNRITLLPGQDFFFADKLMLGQTYCLRFHHGGTRLKEIIHLGMGEIWSS